MPEPYRVQSLLDGDQEITKRPGLERDRDPHAFALDRSGRVLAAAHAKIDAPEAEEIWRALSSR